MLARFTSSALLTAYKTGAPLTLWIPPLMPSSSPIGTGIISSDKITTFAQGTFPTGVRSGYFDAYVVAVSGTDLEFSIGNLMDSYSFENRSWPFSASGTAGWLLYGGSQDTVHRPTFGTTGFYFEREPWNVGSVNWLSGGMVKNVVLGTSESYGNYSYGLGWRGVVLGDKSGTFAGDYNTVFGNNSVALGGEGLISLSSTPYQAVVGKYNDPNNSALFVVGAGTSNTNRSNILEVEASKVSITADISGSGRFTTGNMLLGQSQGGGYFGRTGIKENSLQVSLSSIGQTYTSTLNAKLPYDVAMSSDGRVQMVSDDSFPYVYISEDTGKTWRTVNLGVNYKTVGLSLDGKIQTIADYNGNIYTSTDFGNTWIDRGNLNGWGAVTMSSDGRLQTAVTYDESFGVTNGQVYTSSDYGATWTKRNTNSGTGNYYADIAMSSDGRVQIAAPYDAPGYIGVATLCISYDYGVTWQNISAPLATNAWLGVRMSADGRIILAVIDGGKPTISYDYGKTWQEKYLVGGFFGAAISSDGRIQVACTQSDLGAGNLGRGVFISLDYGNNWRKSNLPESTYRRCAISSDGRVLAATAPLDGSCLFISYATIESDSALTVYNTISSSSIIYASGSNSINWSQTRSIQTSNFTASQGSYYIVNTTSTPITGTLPTSPEIGTTITFQDSFIQWQTNSFTINRNGNMIQGLNENMICDRGGVMFDMTYIGGYIGWRVN
jgi:hypothetical protein